MLKYYFIALLIHAIVVITTTIHVYKWSVKLSKNMRGNYPRLRSFIIGLLWPIWWCGVITDKIFPRRY